jgi:hypothetical protein
MPAPSFIDNTKNFASLYKQANPGTNSNIKPEGAKVTLSASEKLFLGDRTVAGLFKAVAMCIVTLGIGTVYTIIRVDEKIAESNRKADHISHMGCDDSDALNWLYHLPLEEVELIRDILFELAKHEPHALFPDQDKESNSEVTIEMPEGKNFPAFKLTARNGGIYLEEVGGKTTFLMSQEDHRKSVRNESLIKTEETLKGMIELMLKEDMASDAHLAFEPLFDIQNIGIVNTRSPIVSGNLDGSTARQVLLGIQAGIIDIDEKGQEYLVNALNKEVEILIQLHYANDLKTQDLFRTFQNEPELQNALENLSKHLTYKTGHTLLISIGDGMSDRFSKIDSEIRKNMHEKGAIFINGYHDVQGKNVDYQNGVEAKNGKTDEQWKAYQDKVLSNAYYDEETKTLFMHHGLKSKEQKGHNIQLGTAFGTYSYPEKQFDPNNFVAWMNDSSLRRVPSSFMEAENAFEIRDMLDQDDKLTNFKPDDQVMRSFAQESKIRIVHGYEHQFEEAEDNSRLHVIALNSSITASDMQNKVYGFKFGNAAARIGERIATRNSVETMNFLDYM